MKKFKINKNTSKKIVAIALSGAAILSSISGCSNTNMWFKGSNLKYVSVVVLNGEKTDIVSSNSNCSQNVCSGEHKVYKSIINKEMYSTKDCKAKYSSDYLGTLLYKYDITNSENITSYLTIDEIEKAEENNLTEEDISNIISRIFTEEKAMQKVKKAN